MNNHSSECLRELEELADRCREPLFRFAFLRLGLRMDAEDVVQDAFLKWAAAKRHAVDNPQAYLFRIVANACCDRLRRRTALLPLDRLPAPPDETAEEREAREEARRIEALHHYGSGVRKQLEARYGGLAIIAAGKAVRSGKYPGFFVPCKVRLANGETEKLMLALRNDNPERC